MPMTGGQDSGTSATLLRRIIDIGDREAWEQFVDRYAPPVYAWCVQGKLDRQAAEEITGDFVGHLYLRLRELPSGAHENLRLHLGEAAREVFLNLNAPRRDLSAGIPSDGEGCKAPADLPPWDALLKRLEQRFAAELLTEAQHRVRTRVDAEAWAVYEQLEGGVKARELAAALEKTLETIHSAHSNVASSVRQELEFLGLPQSSAVD